MCVLVCARAVCNIFSVPGGGRPGLARGACITDVTAPRRDCRGAIRCRCCRRLLTGSRGILSNLHRFLVGVRQLGFQGSQWREQQSPHSEACCAQLRLGPSRTVLCTGLGLACAAYSHRTPH